jgi:hypothetical protein
MRRLCGVVVPALRPTKHRRYVHQPLCCLICNLRAASGSSANLFTFHSLGTVGDVTDDFAFVTLFPPAMRGYISPLADFCYGVTVLLGFHKDRRPSVPSSEALNDLGSTGLSDSVHAALGLPGSPLKAVDPVTERRLAKAREQLDAKLAAMAAQEETESWEDDEESGATAGS